MAMSAEPPSGELRAVVALAVLVLASATAHAALDADDCAACHQTQTTQAATTGGHAAVLDCGSCHIERRPGRVGPRHRAVARCATCHQTGGHPAHAAAGRPRRTNRNCLVCHDPHGSTNRDLVRTEILFRRKVLHASFTNDDGAAPGGFTDPDAPGRGLCEICHRHTDVYRRNGSGAPHFTEPCTLCHDHAVHFAPVASAANCTLCHGDEATRLAHPSGHTALACDTCHAEVSPTPGPAHRARPACESCHDQATHAPADHAPLPCVQCHDAHGSGNTNLVRDAITTPSGASAPIRFDNIDGLAEGSFASPSAPGTGVCEVCHTTTRHYRADGGGETHFPYSCLPCHRHAKGFAP